MSESNSISSSTSLDSLLEIHGFSPANNRLNLKNLTTPSKSENDAEILSSLNEFIQIPVSWCDHDHTKIITKPPSTSSDNNMSARRGSDEDLAWDENGAFGVTPGKKYPWDEDVYDDFFIKQFWTVKGMSENGDSISTDKNKNLETYSSQDKNTSQNNYSIICSMCSCFLYTLAECFLG